MVYLSTPAIQLTSRPSVAWSTSWRFEGGAPTQREDVMSYAPTATGLRQCLTQPAGDRQLDTAALEKLFLSLA